MSRDTAVRTLTDLYAAGRPTQGELILAAGCEFACQHCIYPPDFARHNSGLPADEWQRIVSALHTDLGIDTFVYSGRSMTLGGATLLEQIRHDLPHTTLGLIDTGISVSPFLDHLERARLDWIDVSVDGMPAAHDLQRRRPGGFAATLAGAHEISRRRLAPRLNVLTCLTTINRTTVAEMTQLLNRQGFKNFFRTPITVVPGVRPNEALALTPAAVGEAIADSVNAASELDDAYVEFGLFEADQLRAIIDGVERDRATRVYHGDHVAWVMERGTTTVCVRFWPASLLGLRELIVNSDGRVLLPKSMAWGRISGEMIVGDMTRERPREIWQRLPESKSFDAFVQELDSERRILGELLGSEET